MNRGRDETPEGQGPAASSDPGSGTGQTEKDPSVPAVETDAGSSVGDALHGGTSEFGQKAPQSPYATSSDAGAGPSAADLSAVMQKSFLDGPIVPGQVLFKRFEVLRKIDDGGMGQVWLVRHIELESERALKFILPRFAIHESVRVRFGREARVMARFGHPNIVVVHDASLSGDAAFIEMEFIRGQSLNKILKPGKPMPLDWIGRILDQLCDALQVAHDHHVVHRDLKPSNLMLVDGRPAGKEFLKILDFGIAKILEHDNRDSGGRTVTEGFLGTVQYASPEQLMGEPVDGRCDIYATGVMLYEMLTGHRPFGGSAMEQMHAHVYVEPLPPSAKNPTAAIPPEVERVVMRCLAKDPAKRPQSPRELAEEFLQALAQVGIVPGLPSASRLVVPPVVDSTAPTDQGDVAAPPNQDLGERTAVGFGSRPGSFAGPLTGRSEDSYLGVGPSGSSDPAVLVEPLNEDWTEPETKPGPFAWLAVLAGLWLPVLTGLALLLVVTGLVVMAAKWWIERPPDQPPPPPGVSAEAAEALNGWRIEGYTLEEKAGLTADGWPRALLDRDGTRFLRFRDAFYLPEGYEPVSQKGEADDGWPAVLARSRDQKLFLRLPGGEFLMGAVTNPEGKPVDPKAPERRVILSGFYMQEHEVTNGEVEDCYTALGISPGKQPQDWRRSFDYLIRDSTVEDAKMHPAVMLSHRDAETIARWARGRLPTEAQWEYAARSLGKDHRYVVGIDPGTPLKLQANFNNFGEASPYGTAIVASYLKDHTEQGLFDMMGNVREWCRDVWEPFGAAKDPLTDPTGPPRPKNPTGPPGSADDEVKFVTRGGSYRTIDSRALTIGIGNPQRVIYESEGQTVDDLGFRVVLECPPAARPAVPAVAAH